MPKRVHPSQLLQAYASDGDALTWDNSVKQWVPGTPAGAAYTDADAVAAVAAALVEGTDIDITVGGGTITIDSTATGGGSGYQPGSADEPPGSPSASDDEFDGSSSVSWTSFGSPDTEDVDTTRPHHLYLRADGTGATLAGRVQSVPSFPFTVTTKLAGSSNRANYHRGGGLCFFPSGAISGSSAPVYFGVNYDSGPQVDRITYTDLDSFGSQTALALGAKLIPVYLRAVFADATHASLQWSQDGWAWMEVQNYTFTFTVALMGLACSEEGGGGVDVFFDWLRVT